MKKVSLPVKFFLQSVNIWHSYKQEDGCLLHFVRLTTILLNVKLSARYCQIFTG